VGEGAQRERPRDGLGGHQRGTLTRPPTTLSSGAAARPDHQSIAQRRWLGRARGQRTAEAGLEVRPVASVCPATAARTDEATTCHTCHRGATRAHQRSAEASYPAVAQGVDLLHRVAAAPATPKGRAPATGLAPVTLRFDHGRLTGWDEVDYCCRTVAFGLGGVGDVGHSREYWMCKRCTWNPIICFQTACAAVLLI